MDTYKYSRWGHSFRTIFVSDFYWSSRSIKFRMLLFPLIIFYALTWASLVAQLVKNLLAVQKTWIQSLSWENSLEKGMTTHPSILAWRIPWTV